MPKNNKSIYEVATGRNNPKWADKVYNQKSGTTITQDIVKVTKPMITAIRNSKAGQLPSMFRKYMK